MALDPKLAAKLQKLQALASCPTGNPNELAAAMAAMTRLMEEHNVQQFELAQLNGTTTTSQDIVELKLPPMGKNQGQWQGQLLNGLAQANRCFVWYTPTNLHLLGEATNAAAVNYLYEFCSKEILRMAREYEKQHIASLAKEFGHKVKPSNPKSRYRAFCSGAALEIGRRANESRRQIEAELRAKHVTALVHIDKMEAELESRKPNCRKGRGGRTSDQMAHLAGRIAGSKVDLGGNGKQSLGPGKKALTGQTNW